MSKIKCALLGMLTILAVCGIASTSAHAADEPCSGSVWGLCLKEGAETELLFIAEEKVAFTSKGLGNSLLEVVEFITIECEETTDTGEFTQSLNLTADATAIVTTEFRKCKVTKPANCTVAEPIAIKNAKVKIGAEEAEEKLGINLKPEVTGGEFTTVNVKGEKCTVAGKSKVTGEITCHLDEFLQDLKEHSLLCLQTDTGMFFAEKKAIFETNDDITLTLHELWSVDLI
jgi:hypothetical protein